MLARFRAIDGPCCTEAFQRACWALFSVPAATGAWLAGAATAPAESASLGAFRELTLSLPQPLPEALALTRVERSPRATTAARIDSSGPPSAPISASRVVVLVRSLDDNKFYALVDENGDHRVDRVLVSSDPAGYDAVENGAAVPHGAELRDVLDVAAAPWVDREPAPPTGGQSHGWRYIRFGADGWLYVPLDAPLDQTPATTAATDSRLKEAVGHG